MTPEAAKCRISRIQNWYPNSEYSCMSTTVDGIHVVDLGVLTGLIAVIHTIFVNPQISIFQASDSHHCISDRSGNALMKHFLRVRNLQVWTRVKSLLASDIAQGKVLHFARQ